MEKHLAASSPISNRNLPSPITAPDNPLDNSLTQDLLDLVQEETDNITLQLHLEFEQPQIQQVNLPSTPTLYAPIPPSQGVRTIFYLSTSTERLIAE